MAASEIQPTARPAARDRLSVVVVGHVDHRKETLARFRPPPIPTSGR